MSRFDEKDRRNPAIYEYEPRPTNSYGYNSDFSINRDRYDSRNRQTSSNYFDDNDSVPRSSSGNANRYPNFSSGHKIHIPRVHDIQPSTSKPLPNQPRLRKPPKTSRQLAIRFAEYTSLQGVPFINRANRWYAKAFWIVVFLAASSAMLFQTYKVFDKYYSYKTTTSVSIGYDKLAFPSVTICNINPIRTSKVKEFGGNIDELRTFLDPKDDYDREWEDPDIATSAEIVTTVATQIRKKRQTRCDPSRQTCSPSDITGTASSWPTDTRRSQSTSTIPPLVGPTQPSICHDDDLRCTVPNLPCKDDDLVCQAKYPSLYESDDQFLENRLNFTTQYESFGDEFELEDDAEEQAADNEDYGGGELSWTMKIRERYRDIMRDYSRNERSQLGHQADSMILTCEFNGRKCQYWNFTQHITTDYGNCNTFNSAFARRRPLKSKQSGAQYGLSLLIYTESHEYFKGLTQGLGMRAVVHPFNTMPFVVDNGLSLRAGDETFVGLRLINMTRIGGKYNECGDEGKFTKSFGYDYTTEACINTCLGRSIFQNCSCYPIESPELYNPRWIKTSQPCKSDTQLKCLYNTRFQHEVGRIDCTCKQACKTLGYDVEISQNAWPDINLWFGLVDAICERNDRACDHLRKKHSNEERQKAVRDNFLYLHVYYRDLNFQVIEEKPEYEEEQFLSDIGGTIGLWLGASLITGMEFLDFIVQLIAHSCRRT